MKPLHLVGMIAIVMLAYPLSMGPFARVTTPSAKSFNQFYKPLILLGLEIPTIDRFLNWYVNLWNPNGATTAATG